MASRVPGFEQALYRHDLDMCMFGSDDLQAYTIITTQFDFSVELQTRRKHFRCCHAFHIENQDDDFPEEFGLLLGRAIRRGLALRLLSQACDM